MFHSLPVRWLACLTLLAALDVSAQTAPRATVAPEPYRSALDGYQPFKEEKVLPWKESNDTVGRIGGWKAYAQEAQGTSAETPPKPAAVDPHAGHGEKAK
jgi:hypothetical protein